MDPMGKAFLENCSSFSRFHLPTPKAVLTLQYIGFMGSHVMGSLRGMGVPLLVYSYKIQMFFFANKNHGFLEDGLLS